MNNVIYKLVIFDLDGTLLDTAVGVRYSIKETLRELGENSISDKLINKFIGPPLTESFQLLMGYDEEKALFSTNLFNMNYQKKGVMMANVYPDMVSLLKKLTASNITLAVATNKTHNNAIKILNVFQLDSYFKFIKGNIPGSRSDKTSIIQECINKFNVHKKNTILIGDAIQDEMAAQKVGIDFLAVTYGYGFCKDEPTQNISCVKRCDNCNEILEYMNRE